MKKTIKLLSCLFLLGGFSNLACSQNVRTLAIKNVAAKQIHNTKAFEQFKKLVNENEELYKNNMTPEVSEIKNEQGNYINACILLKPVEPKYNSENQLRFTISSCKQENCTSVLSKYDELKTEIYDEAGKLVKTMTLNKSDESDYEKNFSYDFDLNSCELEKGKIYSVKISNSNDELLGKSDFCFQYWMTQYITGENGKVLNDKYQVVFIPSIDKTTFGVARIEVMNNKVDENSIFKSGSKQFTINFYNLEGEHILTKKAIQLGSETDKYLDININKNEMASVESRNAMFIEIFDENEEYLGSIPYIDLYIKWTVNRDKLTSDVKSYFLDSNNQPINCWIRVISERYLKQDDSIESILYRYIPVETFMNNMAHIKSTDVNDTLYAYLISRINDKNNKFANYSGKLFFKYEYDELEPLVLESEDNINFDKCGLNAYKIKLTDEFYRFFSKIKLDQSKNVKIHVYSDKEMTKEIETMHFNTESN